MCRTPYFSSLVSLYTSAEMQSVYFRTGVEALARFAVATLLDISSHRGYPSAAAYRHALNPAVSRPERGPGRHALFYSGSAGRSTVRLHEFWDDLVLGSTRFQTVRNTATELRLRPAHAREQLAELAQPQFEQWEQESFGLERARLSQWHASGSTDKENGAVLPADYAQTVKPIGERRMILAGYRVADVLRQLFE